MTMEALPEPRTASVGARTSACGVVRTRERGRGEDRAARQRGAARRWPSQQVTARAHARARTSSARPHVRSWRRWRRRRPWRPRPRRAGRAAPPPAGAAPPMRAPSPPPARRARSPAARSVSVAVAARRSARDLRNARARTHCVPSLIRSDTIRRKLRGEIPHEIPHLGSACNCCYLRIWTLS